MAGESELAKVGVSLIVQNLGKFKNDVGQAGQSLDGLKSKLGLVAKAFAAITPKTTLLEKAFKSLGSSIKNFAQNIIGRILTIAFGVLVRDTIRKVISSIGEMIQAVIAGGDAFQRLEIRLNRFNMNALKESGMAANEIMAETTRLTKEQIQWALNLAGLTIYDSADIANAYSLARSYGFLDKEARSLTEDILNFTSGMGLSGMQIERIITNLGQMMQQGKITGTELRDLARGSLVPVNKILGIISKEMGITTEELNKMRKAGTTDPQWFVEAFGMFVGEDFAGATEDMAKSFTGAMDNVKDIFIGRISAMISSPIMSKLGEKISSILLGFYNGSNVKPEFARAFERIGESLVRIIDKLFGLLPGVNSIADSIIKALSGIATWLEQNEDAIVEWIKNAIVFLRDLAYTIKVLVIPAISKAAKWIYENREAIWYWATTIVKAWLAWQLFIIGIRALLYLIANLLGGIIKAITIFAGWKAATTLLKGALALLGIDIGALLGPIILLTGAVLSAGVAWASWGYTLSRVGARIAEGFNLEQLKQSVIEAGNVIFNILTSGPWYQAGVLMIQGLLAGIYESAVYLYAAVTQIANTLISIWNSIWGIASPSKVMQNSGIQMMQGLAKGIIGGTKGVVDVTKKAASSIFGSFKGSGNSWNGGNGGGGGQNDGNAGQYLNNQGEVMRSNMDVVKGDPCAKDSTAGCLAEKLTAGLAGGMAGIGAGIMSGMQDAIGVLKEFIAGVRGESKAGVIALEKELQNTRFGFSEGVMNLANGTLGMLQETSFGFTETAMKLADGTLMTLGEESKRQTDGSLMIQKSTAFTISMNSIMSMMGVKNFAISTMAANSATFISLISGLVSAVISFISSQSATTTTTSSSGSSSSSSTTNNVTNNFNGSQTGQQVTFDFEAGQFWV